MKIIKVVAIIISFIFIVLICGRLSKNQNLIFRILFKWFFFSFFVLIQKMKQILVCVTIFSNGFSLLFFNNNKNGHIKWKATIANVVICFKKVPNRMCLCALNFLNEKRKKRQMDFVEMQINNQSQFDELFYAICVEMTA